MIRFSCRMYARSLRWVPPLVLLVLWAGLARSPDSPEASAGPLVLGLFVTGLLSTVLLANTDSADHRHLLAAAAGGAAALHRRRIAASLVLAGGTVSALTVLFTGLSAPWSHLTEPGVAAATASTAAAVLAALAGGALAGVGAGALLARPVVASLATSVVGGICMLLGVALVKPFLRQLDAIGSGSHAAAYGALVEGAAVLAVGAVAAPWLAGRREGPASG